MRKPVVANLFYAQASFFLCLAVAVVKTTAAFSHNRGLSFYGEHWSTAVPYGSGFFLCDYFLLLAASELPTDVRECRRLALLLRLLAVLLLGVLLTPDTVNSFFNWSHNIAGSVLFLFELSFSVWLAVRCFANAAVWSLILLLLIAGVLALLSDFKVMIYLSEGILVFQLVFGVLLIYTVAKYLGRSGLFAKSDAPTNHHRAFPDESESP